MNAVIDTSVIVVFSMFIMLVGFSFSRTGRNLKSFFAAGEAVPWFIGGLSLFMSFFSAGTFVAWGSIAYKYGWVAITIQWTMCIGALVTGLYLAPRWKATGNLTAAEFIRERLGIHVQKIYIYIFMAVSLLIKGSVLYSVARLVSASLGLPLMPSTVVLGLFMIAYTAVGGLWAVMVTDILQFVVLTAAVLIIIPLAFDAAGGMQHFLHFSPEGFFDVVNGEYTWGFILAFALYHIFYIGGNWTFVQRYTSVDTPRSASRVAYIFSALYIISPVLWMLPPMLYKSINPNLQGLDTENAYLMICQHVLPAGLMGLILTGMYFSTSASANTALNVVSAVFTNDIYKGSINPHASDKKLMSVARISSWFFGLGMIGIALMVPYIGGIVEFTLSIGAITGGPLLAPPIWALFSRRLTGKATLYITGISLTANLVFKMILPLAAGYGLSRANEMLLGVGLPFIMLVLYELYAYYMGETSDEYIQLKKLKMSRRLTVQEVSPQEELEIRKQNRFGLRVIAFSLAFIALLLYGLCFFSQKSAGLVACIATIILLVAIIPLRAAGKVKINKVIVSVLLFAGWLYHTPAVAQRKVLRNSSLELLWTGGNGQWRLESVSVKDKDRWRKLPHTSGEYTLLYAKEKPGSEPVTLYDKAGKEIIFPEPQYRYIIPIWKAALEPVPMNTAGEAIHFYPSAVKETGNNGLTFMAESDKAVLTSTWRLDEKFPADILVKMSLQAKQEGYYSLATPTLAVVKESELSWAGIPGYFQSNVIEKDLIKAYAYMQGIPDKPVIVRERTAATLSPFISTRGKVTLAVVPDPGTGRDPWEQDVKTQNNWQLGLSLMNRKADLTPTAYHPILGEKGSFLKKGDTITFSFRYVLQQAGWYTVYKHAVNDIYRFNDFLALRKTRQSLTSRMLEMHKYVADDRTSLWNIENYKGVDIGAQSYLGGVFGSEKDAMKNSDYGAMWMLATIMDDAVLQRTRLPYARNFKLLQQDNNPGFFHGAAAGQYYLSKSKRFTEEWGPYVEPVGLTYYMMMDVGNILLFSPGDTALKTTLRSAADRLLAWMDKDGKWAVAYDYASGKKLFTEVEDLRPTFYGLLIAYKMLKDKKYLEAARRGADWYIQHAVKKGQFLGVCGDARFVPDFATGQSAQALLDMYEITKEERYLQAAISTAQLYTTSIYTHPIPATRKKIVNGVQREDWEISQAGLSFEHGGILGSANHRGPILLAGHAGLFVRMFRLTGDSLFLNMARAGALGRDAFVDKATSVASYYWDVMDKGAGPYPHHAWWQIGWITDYLLSEIEMRSSGRITFPRGFITPKVGPHQTAGFAAGSVYGTPAHLLLKEGMLKTDNPYLDYFCAVNRKQKKLFLLLLNNDNDPLKGTLYVDYSKVITDKILKPVAAYKTSAGGDKEKIGAYNEFPLAIAPYGLSVVEIDYDLYDEEDAERTKLIAASQTGAPPLYFDPGDTAVPLIASGNFNDEKECIVRNGLPHFFKKAVSGKPLTIGFIGGSITQGDQCYRPQTARYIQSMFPAVTMKGINAGVSGTGTDLGACRLYDQLLRYHPDLVFVEFAVNGAYANGMEGIIRQIRKYDPAIDICLIYTIYNGQTKTYAAERIPDNIQRLETIAAHYGLPSVHLGMEAAMLENEGKLVWKSDSAMISGKIVFSRDGTHPLLAGGNLYAAAVARALNKMRNITSPAVHALPPPLIADNWEDAAMYAPLELATFSQGWSRVDTENSHLKKFSGWFPYIMKADRPGEYFTCRFKGTMFGLFDIGGPEAGQLEVIIDGKPVKLVNRSPRGTRFLSTVDPTDNSGNSFINRFNNFCNNRYRGQYEFIMLEPGVHTVTMRLSAEKADKIEILGDKQLEDITRHPAKYNRTVVYVGKILLRGKPY